MIIPSICAFTLLFVEASINLTYYKDCIFMFTSLLIFFGMFWVNFEYKKKDSFVVQGTEENMTSGDVIEFLLGTAMRGINKNVSLSFES